MTSEDMMYVKSIQDQILNLQESEEREDLDLQARMLGMLKEKQSLSEEERIHRVM